MRKYLSLICIAMLLSLTSCIDIIEEIFLNRNGSGKYTLTLDMKSAIAMKDLIFSQAPMSKRDSAKLSQDKIDSVIYFTDMADSTRRKLSHPELIERATMHIKVDEEAGVLFAALEFPFTNINEVNTLMEDLGKAGKTKDISFGPLGFLSYYKVTKKSIERTTVLEPNTPKADSIPQLSSLAAGLFASSRIKTIYHLPGKVKSTSIPDAFIRGNDCVVEMTYSDFKVKGKSMDGKVTFK